MEAAIFACLSISPSKIIAKFNICGTKSINYNIMIAIAKGIVTANDRTILKENGGTT